MLVAGFVLPPAIFSAMYVMTVPIFGEPIRENAGAYFRPWPRV
jgi:hypothetical protein